MIVCDTLDIVNVRREAYIAPVDLYEVKHRIEGSGNVVSLWGDKSTVKTASLVLGTDLEPHATWDDVTFSDSGLPIIYGVHDTVVVAIPVRDGATIVEWKFALVLMKWSGLQ